MKAATISPPLLVFLALLSAPLLTAAVSPATAAAAGGGAGDPYRTLGVDRGASPSEIKKAYRRLALRHHPDKVPASERDAAERKFKKIGGAYDCIGDERRRELYDRYGEAAMDPNFNPDLAGAFGSGGVGGGFGGGGGNFGGGPMPFPFSSPGSSPGGEFTFEDAAAMFGGGGPPGRGGPLGGGFGGGGMPGGVGGFNVDLSSLFEDLLRGKQPTAGQRYGGGWSGFGQGTAGAGRSREQRAYARPFYCTLEELSDPRGRRKRLRVKNPVTDPATGETRTAERMYTVDVKPGWKAGTKVKFPARGNFPPMTFVLREKPHPYLRRDGDDLLWRCTLSPRRAKRGARLTVPLPDGETLTVSTKEEGPIKDGHRMAVKGKGMPIKGGPQRGDLIIEFMVREEEGKKR